MKKIILIGTLSLYVLSGCTASIGVGTGINIGGVGIGLSASQPLKKKEKKTAEQVIEERLEKEKEMTEINKK